MRSREARLISFSDCKCRGRVAKAALARGARRRSVSEDTGARNLHQRERGGEITKTLERSRPDDRYAHPSILLHSANVNEGLVTH